MRTVYLGTSEFAAAVLDRLAASPHRPCLVITRPDRPKGRGRRVSPPPVALRARELGIDVLQPADLHAEESLAAIAAADPDALVVCAFGALVKAPLLDRYEILNVHPSLLPRWRGAAPIERAIMAGDGETGVAIMRLTAGLDSGPVALTERVAIRPDDDYGTLARRLQEIGGELLVRALDERPPFAEQPEDGVTYAEKIIAADRSLDFTRTPEDVERVVRALRPHIGARIPLPGGQYLGVWAAAPGGETLAPAGGRVRREGERLFLDCNGGALELLEVQPPGGRRMPAAEWLRGRPDATLTDFWLDPRLPERDLDTLVSRAREEWHGLGEWAPHLAALCWRGSDDVLQAARELTGSDDPADRAVGAYVLGQLGIPTRTAPAACAAALETLAAREADPDVLAAIANAFDNLGREHGADVLLRLADHPDARVREGVARALGGCEREDAVTALVSLSGDREPEIREWATFALAQLTAADGDEVRGALRARLDDEEPSVRIEAAHGLAVRGDAGAADTAIALLEAGHRQPAGVWRRHALEETAIRLAALSGDSRFAPYLPPLDRYAGTVLEDDLRRAHERVAAPA